MRSKLLFQAWKNRKQIFEGIKNTVIRDQFVEEVAKDRMEACKTCDHIDNEGSKCEIPGTAPCCGLCGCSLSVKLRALSTMCPDKKSPKWLPVMEQSQEDELQKLN